MVIHHQVEKDIGNWKIWGCGNDLPLQTILLNQIKEDEINDRTNKKLNMRTTDDIKDIKEKNCKQERFREFPYFTFRLLGACLIYSLC